LKIVFIFLFLFSLNTFSEEKACQKSKICFQTSVSNQDNFSEPIKYEQSQKEAISLLSDVLNSVGFHILKVEDHKVTAEKVSTFLRVRTFFIFTFNDANTIHFTAYTDSPKLDWGKTSDYVEEIKFRFYQNNM